MVLVVVGVVGRWVEDSQLGRSLDSPLSWLLRAERRYNKALGDTDADGGGEGASRSVVSQQSPSSSSILVYWCILVMPRASGLEESVNSDAECRCAT